MTRMFVFTAGNRNARKHLEDSIERPVDHDIVFDTFPRSPNGPPPLPDLADYPRPSGCKKLRGREGYRIWVGRGYRVLYHVDDGERRVEVFWVGSYAPLPTLGHHDE